MAVRRHFFKIFLLKTWNISNSGSIVCPLQLIELFEFTNPVILVSSHLPSEEHTQEKISEDCKKEGFDISISPLALHSSFPSIYLVSCLMIHCFPRLFSNKTFTFHKTGAVVKVRTKIYI